MLHIPGIKEAHVLGFLKASAMFTMDPEQYLRDIAFWKKGFELIHTIHNNHRFRTYSDCADYLDYMKYQSTEIYDLKGRTGMSLLRAVNDWHGDIFLSSNKQNERMKWKGIDKPDMAFNFDNKEYLCRQLETGKELKVEGEKMKHCVTTYAPMCFKGHCSIWSLREKKDNEEHILTLEVTKGKVVQARGKFNALPTKIELSLVHDWAERMEFEVELIKNL